MDKQHEAILAMLDEAMTILRDGKSFNPESGIFGVIKSTDEGPENTGRVYRYENDTMPPSKLVMTTEADPLNYFEDRSKVAVVPSQLLLRFYKPVRGFTWTEIQRRLDLADYWVDTGGNRQEGNCFPASPPNDWITICRYRANEHIDSRFPVNVELGFFGPTKEGMYDLDRVKIRRAYPYLTPEMRKQKREEKALRIRESGYTGVIDD
ncbi:hypothetical protein P5W99_29470 [Paraburkholderia sp. A3BS-1L]|uniref:hypothetical protein n=1 Tax=Paraburkholderia sp. A3BS-1L TaxID=3028375 RepID=UPI003DA8BEA9